MKEEHAVKAIIIKDGRFLVLKQQVDGKIFYTLPGGRVNTANLETELKREVKEETGLDIEIIKPVGEWSFVREKNGIKTICKTYMCKPLTKAIDKSGSEDYEKIKKLLWMKKEDFIKGGYNNNKSLIKLLRKFPYN